MDAFAAGRHMIWVTDGDEAGLPRPPGAIRKVGLHGIDSAAISSSDVVIVDVDLRDAAAVLRVRRMLEGARVGTRRIIAIDRASRACAVQAHGLGASDLIGRPVSLAELKACLAKDGAGPAPELDKAVDARNHPIVRRSIGAATGSLKDMFSAFSANAALDLSTLAQTSDYVIDAVSGTSYADWIATVRHYHQGTYQHCLMVTGTAALFACKTGMRRQDVETLTVAALLHDIGKAMIPLAILDKPGDLDEDELAAIRDHPVSGHAYLARQGGLSPAVLDAVLHHHEMLDGSGYPHGLKGREISDLTRIVTICDVYSALVERRAYKTPMPPQEAIDILVVMAMDGKVELALVRALEDGLQLPA